MGSGCCVCSCTTLACDCKPNTDPDPYGYTEPQIDISIDRNQYENLKTIAYILYEANDLEANEAYEHLGNAIQFLKEKNAVEFHKQKDSYYTSLYKITAEEAKTKLNDFFQSVGVVDRV